MNTMSSLTRIQSLRSLAAILIFVLAAAFPAFAGNTWTGGGGSINWGDNNNWGGSAPGYGTLTFNTGGTQGTTSNNSSITSQSELLWTGSSSWTMNGSTTLSLYDNGGVQSKIENQSSGLVTINAPITFAANNGTPPNPFGEINAVNGNITFGTGTLTVNGSSVNGIKMFGASHTTTFNNTVSASGKWFGLTGATTTMAVGGSFTSGDIYVMNGGTLEFNSGGTVTTSALRLGGDFGTTGNQNQTLGGTLQLTSLTGGQSFASIINTVTGNTSNALLIDSLNTSGTNTLAGASYLDSDLKTQVASGGTLSFTGGSIDVKIRKLTVSGAGTTIINEAVTSSFGAGGLLVKEGSGTLILQGTSNSYTGTTASTLNSNGTQINAGTLGIYGDQSLGLAPAGAYNNIQFTGSGTLQDTSNNISLNATRNISVASGATATFDNNGNTFTINGIINGTGGKVAVSGSGTTTFSGVNTYTGTTTVSSGTLIVSSTGAINSGSSISISSSATLQYNSSTAAGSISVSGILQGTGTVGAVTVNSGGSLAPGNSAGILTTGNLSLLSGGTLSAEINSATVGTGYDQVNVSGTVGLAGALSVTLGGGYTPTNGTLFFLINNDNTDAVTGTFSNANFAINQEFTLGGQRWFISYVANYTGGGSGTFTGGNDVALYAIPEPGTVTLLGIGALAIGFIARRRKG